jgi:hypothetical protein
MKPRNEINEMKHTEPQTSDSRKPLTDIYLKNTDYSTLHSLCRSFAAFLDEPESTVLRARYERCLKQLRQGERLQSRRLMIDFHA